MRMASPLPNLKGSFICLLSLTISDLSVNRAGAGTEMFRLFTTLLPRHSPSPRCAAQVPERTIPNAAAASIAAVILFISASPFPKAPHTLPYPWDKPSTAMIQKR
jgi:hypothetical protein